MQQPQQSVGAAVAQSCARRRRARIALASAHSAATSIECPRPVPEGVPRPVQSVMRLRRWRNCFPSMRFTCNVWNAASIAPTPHRRPRRLGAGHCDWDCSSTSRDVLRHRRAATESAFGVLRSNGDHTYLSYSL
eukprot:1966197-Prymnesium_polylepis.1